MAEKKVIWITGASSGIGKALAIKFAENGWIVAASARRENLLKELQNINQNIYPYPLDVTDIEKEYNRLLDNGVEFHSAPKDFGQVKATYGRDCDGNIFEIQEIIDQNHPAKVF